MSSGPLLLGLMVVVSIGVASAQTGVVNIESFGASENASPSTNSAAIQAAINSASSVYIPPTASGYRFDTTLAIPANRVIFGEGRQSLLQYTGSGDAITLNYGGALAEWNLLLEKFRLTTATGANGIRIYNLYHALLRDLWIDNFRGAAIITDGPVAVHSIRIFTCFFLQNGYGIRLTGNNSQNQFTITGNRIQASTLGPGLSLEQATKAWAIMGNTIEGNTGSEIFLGVAADGVTISGNHFETNRFDNHGIVMAGIAQFKGIDIRGNGFFNNQGPAAVGRALYLLGSHAVPYKGIRFNGNAVYGYGSAANSAIDFQYRRVDESDFSGNSFEDSVTPFLFVPSYESSGTILRRLSRLATFSFAPLLPGTSVEAHLPLPAGTLPLILGQVYTVSVTPTRMRGGIGWVDPIEPGLVWAAHVIAPDTVTIRLANTSAHVVFPAPRDWGIEVKQLY